MKKLFLGLCALALVGGGCLGGDQASRLRYVTHDTEVTTGEGLASAWFTADELVAASAECGTNHDAAHYQTFINGVAGASSYSYIFTAQGDTQDPMSWTVVMIPNVTGYTTMKDFKADFDICAVGGVTYPLMLNANWLVFSESCGSGYADGTNRPVGCELARRNTTLSLNPPAFADDLRE